MGQAMNAEHIAFQGEVQLLNWSETHSGGAKVVLQLADADDLEKFKAMTVRKGKIAGQRLAVVMVEIGDDEQPIAQAETKQRAGELCIVACNFCKDPAFIRWVGAIHPNGARAFILDRCVVSSRKDLDTDRMAATRFHTLVREPFLAWRAKQGAGG
jgi:hypothetical protein